MRFYKNLLQANSVWLKRAILWSALWLVVGFVTSISRADLKPMILESLERIFREILGQEQLAINFSSVLLIFKNNLQAAAVVMFLGIILGIVPLISLALNFFILGFLAGAFIFTPIAFLATVLPHGIIEIPAFIIAASFGLRLGWFCLPTGDLPEGERRSYKKKFLTALKQNLLILPLITLLFFVAAVIEVFVSGRLAEYFAR